MAITEIRPGIHYVGVNDRTTTRFEALWSLPIGVSYNAYLVVGEKIALIDTVEEAFGSRLEANIRETIGDRKIDYLVVNHMEPDHSSSIAALRRLYPDLEIVGNAKTLQMIGGFYGIAGGTVEVKEGDMLDLGGGKMLSFHMIPMVHWPETMVTWCAERADALLGRRFRHVRSPRRRHHRLAGRYRPLLGRDAPLLRLHRGQIRRPGAEGPAEGRARSPSRRSARRTAPYGSGRSPG